MSKVYVDRKTGEIFNAEEVNLMNLCSGLVNTQFMGDLELLSRRMNVDDKGSITINIKVEKKYNNVGEQIILIDVESGLTLPKAKMSDPKEKVIADSGEVMEKHERNNLFENIPQIEYKENEDE